MKKTLILRFKNLEFTKSVAILLLLFVLYSPGNIFGQCTATFIALEDLCLNAGVQADLGSGTPTGGVYSGAGVTDDGNGMTYSFDPAAAGVGVHNLTYMYTDVTGCTASASDDVEVFALPAVDFTALADLCIDVGEQADLGGGTPTGGVYSGAGVTDDGNGMTYSFDPSAAGVGVHSLTYTYTDANGCTNSADDDVEVFSLPVVDFTALGDLCIDAGVQADLGGGAPTGGVYSGAGVTDDGNGMTYSFDPSAAGVGVHSLTYTYTDANGCTNLADDDVEVFSLPVVDFTALADLCIDAGVQVDLGGGAPTGGVYSGAGVTDDGNGMTYSFAAAAAGVGVHTLTYTFTDMNGCTNSASDDVEVFALPVVAFTAPADMCVSAGVQAGLGGGTPTGGVYSGAGVTDNGDDTYDFDPSAAGVGVHSLTYTYTDMNGCSDAASDDVEVIDLMFDCPSDNIIQLMPEQCDTIVIFADPEFTEDCPEAVITQIEGLPSDTLFPIGENIISFEGRDAAGNADTCTWSIIVKEYIPNGLACDGVVNFSVDKMTCSGSLTPSMVLDVSSIGCADSCTITITGEDGIKRPADFTAEDIGKTFEYEICCGGICCWGDVNVEYKFKPEIICVESDTLSCTQSSDESLITPDISMSCADVTLITVDSVYDYFLCDTLFTATLTTRYTAIDEYGNTSDTCSQIIYFERTNLDSITPVQPFALYNNKALECGSGYATTSQGYPFPALSVTGAPKLKAEDGSFVDLYPFTSNVICNGFAEFKDEILLGSTSCVTKIRRTFTIGEWWCSKTNEREFVQLIEVVDFTGPIISCIPDMTISTSSFSCEGYTSFDLPEILYDCNGGDAIRIDLSAPTSPTGFVKDYAGQILELPVGKNDLTYHVYDGCGNRSDCTFSLTVDDHADPIAICDQFTSVGIGLDNLTRVSAESIDDGSFDECGPVILEVARMDSPGFDDLMGFGPHVDITCEDVGSIVMVGLLVTDAIGNTNMCMVSVEVTDKIDAQFTCPGPMEVECNFPFDPDNLGAFFGEVEIFDNCPAANTVDDRLIGSLSSCGSGVLTREIRLINAQGDQVDFCSQEITFRNGDQLEYSDITPPQSEVTVTGCGIESIDPSILGIPTVPDQNCQQTAIGIENDTFPFTLNGACLKIIRTFNVIDWCIEDGPGSVFDPFVFTQTIKVNNTEGPEIEDVFADSVFCSYEVGCGAININGYLTATADDDCTDENELLNTFEVRNSDGIVVNYGSGLDASGTYDVDKYTVRFISEDKCGNQTLAESTFEVRSCKLPTPYCLESLTTTLIAMDTTGDGNADVEMVMLPASFFDAGSYHACGYDVTVSFSEDKNDTIASFFCSDTMELQEIELWVTDEYGGQDFCTAYLDVQNNDTIDLCGGLKPVDIAGRIYTESDAELKEAEVELRSAESLVAITDENGMYQFASMPQGGNYQVSPLKDNDHLNGVSTLDLVMIQRHILGIAPLNSAYKMIAADINNNEQITASDLVALRKVILGVDVSFPDNTSWRFIDAEYEFANEANPWESPFAEVYNIEGLNEDMQIDFVAVKVGDVNGNVDMNVKAGVVSETRSSKILTLEMANMSVEQGNLYNVEVRGTEALQLYGMQHSLELDGIEIIDIASGSLDMKKEYTSERGGQLHVSYASANGDVVQDGDVLYSMVLKASRDGELSEMISLSTKGLASESYHGEELGKGEIAIEWRDSEANNLVEMLSLEGNSPNPWRNTTELRFYLPSSGKVNLIINDANGKILLNKVSEFSSGENNFTITSEDIGISGVLFFKLRFKDQIVNGKMIRIE